MTLKLLYLIAFIMLFTSCGPSRDANGNYWKGYQVGHRIFARPEHHPNQPFLTRQQIKKSRPYGTGNEPLKNEKLLP